MSHRHWHILRDNTGFTLCRHLPPRFDFAVCTVLPCGKAIRLAHQIRQDLWRALQNLRGFSPVVRLERAAEGWLVTAGGRAAGPVPAAVVARADAVLNDASNRVRWVRHAGWRP
ncbi:hypothetical protein [Tateyamaria sp. ANG-S1]|uniref:hypothetical protein n=1 Tax=Tateyamaria sp. ANG-S1 TaxID=1577905 RepID=UPI00057ECD81|nr:hypothetical protein [Tateyamaria sp. ANG-S1]KIC50799.1 hypothetical protein RA29_02435 [Tateyamaria sp. ANG-S1]